MSRRSDTSQRLWDRVREWFDRALDAVSPVAPAPVPVPVPVKDRRRS